LVITHQRGDTHQDHAAVRDEVVRCFKNYCSIFYGYQPWNNLEGFLRGSAYVKLSTRLVALKLDALEAYTSQHLELRGYFDRSWQESQLMLFGGLVGSTYAEAFGVARLVYE
jgi:LmbE family N-acetylglucosaminyl deacetylase